MARGKIPWQTPSVPTESFIAIDTLYNHVRNLDADLAAAEGKVKRFNTLLVANTTLAVENSLAVILPANRRVRVVGELYFTDNVKFRHFGPASPARVLLARTLRNNAALTNNLDTAYSTADIVVTASSVVSISGLIYNGVTAGVFGISWAQNTSSGTSSSLLAGSWLQYSQID